MEKTFTKTTQGGVVFNYPTDYVEVKEPTLVGFEKIGDRLHGVLLDLRNERLKDEETGVMKEVLTARMELENGEHVKFRPSWDLRTKLGRRYIGKTLFIIFDSESDVTAGKGNKMKVFRVFASKEAFGEVPFVAQDDDLPESMR